MAARSSDPLTAATTSILLPQLRPAGFRRRSNRNIARVRDDILPYIDLQLSAYGGKTFCVNYAAFSLFHPRDYMILAPGDRLRGDNGGNAWLSAKTHDAADSSMRLVVQMAQAQAIPFFESTNSAAGLLAHLESETWGSAHHLNFEMACCAAKLGRLPEAQTLARRAIELYREDGRPWCGRCIEHCEELLASIEIGRGGELLQEWRDYSIAQLKLEKFV